MAVGWQKAQVVVSHYPILEMRCVTIALRAVSTLHAQGTYLVWRPDSSLEVQPTPYTLHPTPYTQHPTPYTQHPTPYTLHPTPYTLHPARTSDVLQDQRRRGDQPAGTRINLLKRAI